MLECNANGYSKKQNAVSRRIKKIIRHFFAFKYKQHSPEFYKQLSAKEFAMTDISEKFKKAYYSCQVGMRKPDEKIFQLVMEENNLMPEETLFLDDSAVNVETADKLGMHVILMMPGDEIENKIKEFIASQKEVSLH